MERSLDSFRNGLVFDQALAARLELSFVNLQAENADGFCKGLVRYLDGLAPGSVNLYDTPPWTERKERLLHGEVDLGFICGMTYVEAADSLDLLAAPVMANERYGDKPVYFSDVLVRDDSPYRTFSDLRHASWAFNEPGSHSGYNLTRYQLATMGEGWEFFGHVVESGAHQRSLELLLCGDVDAAAIDTMVLEMEELRHPGLLNGLRRIEVWGPSPAPPMVATRQVPRRLRDRLRQILCHMHEDAAGCALLSTCGISRFASVTDDDYDPIRRMAALAQRLPVQPLGLNQS